MSKLLIDEPALQVLPSLAVTIGLNEAIIVQQVHYWIKGKSGKTFDGQRWVYNSYSEWKEQFPFWSEDTIARAFKSAESQGVLISRQQANYDRRKWYRIDYEKLDTLHDRNLPASMTANCKDGSPQLASLLTETTETTTEIAVATAESIESLLPSKKSQPIPTNQPHTAEEYKARIAKTLSVGQSDNGSITKALETLTGRKLDRPTTTESKYIFDLREWGATPAKCAHFSHFWSVDQKWRGENSRPTLKDVRDMWDTAQSWKPALSVTQTVLTPAEAQAKARAARGNF